MSCRWRSRAKTKTIASSWPQWRFCWPVPICGAPMPLENGLQRIGGADNLTLGVSDDVQQFRRFTLAGGRQ